MRNIPRNKLVVELTQVGFIGVGNGGQGGGHGLPPGFSNMVQMQ